GALGRRIVRAHSILASPHAQMLARRSLAVCALAYRPSDPPDVEIHLLSRGRHVTLCPAQDEDGVIARRTNFDHAWRGADPPSALVLGFGNILLGDDGAGVQLVDRLRAQLATSACEF